MARQERVTVMLEGVVKERLHHYAVAMGLTDSALGAFILGNWVMQNDLVSKPMVEEMQKLMVGAVREQIKGMIDLTQVAPIGDVFEG